MSGDNNLNREDDDNGRVDRTFPLNMGGSPTHSPASSVRVASVKNKS